MGMATVVCHAFGSRPFPRGVERAFDSRDDGEQDDEKGKGGKQTTHGSYLPAADVGPGQTNFFLTSVLTSTVVSRLERSRPQV